MTKVVLHGCNGRMGLKLAELIKKEETMCVTAGVDLSGESKRDFPVYGSLNEIKEDFDVIIDFSAAKAIDTLLTYCEEKKVPLVLCSTGLSEEQQKRADEVSRTVPLLRSANMSLGINIMVKLLKTASDILYHNGFDIEIIEKHHKMKLDAPSGTALLLADAIKDSLKLPLRYVYDRSEDRKQRDKEEVGISAVRGGSIVGDHEVLFAGEDEVIEIKHSAYSRAVFAKGAMAAAMYLKGKPAGKYSLSDVIG